MAPWNLIQSLANRPHKQHVTLSFVTLPFLQHTNSIVMAHRLKAPYKFKACLRVQSPKTVTTTEANTVAGI